MAALRLERMRSRERARSPISSRNFTHLPLTEVSKSPMVTLSAILVSPTIGRTIQCARRNESNKDTESFFLHGIRAKSNMHAPHLSFKDWGDGFVHFFPRP